VWPIMMDVLQSSYDQNMKQETEKKTMCGEAKENILAACLY